MAVRATPPRRRRQRISGSVTADTDRIVGPFESSEEAERYADGEWGATERYAVVESLAPPST